MRKITLLFLVQLCFIQLCISQTNPAITEWLQNTTETGNYYDKSSGVLTSNNIVYNVQSVEYSDDYAYISTNGIPSYYTGPYLDRNPNVAESQDAIYKIPLNPVENTGTKTETTLGNNGIFINGVSLFDYRDGVSWDHTIDNGDGTYGDLCGSMNMERCSNSVEWNRDAIPAEMEGFDCSKGHPANGNYHHHQNPSAFNLDLVELSDVCDLYPSDALYTISTTEHSPLLGYAYDGFPVYGAYAYANIDGTGGIVRMRSSYELDDSATTRTNGPNIDYSYTFSDGVVTIELFNGYFREDYTYNDSYTEAYYLDEHNGRFCVTPEYPDGIYCYFTTVDENHNSAYPYMIGPTFYGTVSGEIVNSITETTTSYDSTLAVSDFDENRLNLNLYPNPAQDFIAVQSSGLQTTSLKVDLINELGQVVLTSKIDQGSTLTIIETHTLYNGIYFIKVSGGETSKSYKVIINK